MGDFPSLYKTVKKQIANKDNIANIESTIHEHITKVNQDTASFYNDLNRTERLVASFPKSPTKNKIYSHLISTLSEAFSSERLMIWARRNKVSLDPFPSFTSCMNRRAYMKQALRKSAPENLLINKNDGYEFANHCGLNIPNRSLTPTPARDVQIREGTVIKPVDSEGGKGVYIINSEDDIFGVKYGEKLSGFENLREKIVAESESKWISNDKWIWEEIIYENEEERIPARDLKFYCFYGECPLVLEVVRYPDKGYCWWNNDKQNVDTGKYNKLKFKGIGFPDIYLETAKSISKKIPAPFIRIDFMLSEKGPVLGEFTGHPGSYERFNKETDNLLGKHFISAEHRILKDSINGKQFPYFSKFFSAEEGKSDKEQ